MYLKPIVETLPVTAIVIDQVQLRLPCSETLKLSKQKLSLP